MLFPAIFQQRVFFTRTQGSGAVNYASPRLELDEPGAMPSEDDSHGGTPIARCFTRENPIQWMILGHPHMYAM